MPVTKKTYTPLVDLPAVLVDRCAQVLPNKLQCWRGADFLVEEELTAEPKADAKAATPTRTYQFCAMHATIQQRADTLVSQEEASGKATPPDSDPKSIHSRMMQAEHKKSTVRMPVGS